MKGNELAAFLAGHKKPSREVTIVLPDTTASEFKKKLIQKELQNPLKYYENDWLIWKRLKANE
jgi:hypothetical protein